MGCLLGKAHAPKGSPMDGTRAETPKAFQVFRCGIAFVSVESVGRIELMIGRHETVAMNLG